MYVCMLMYRIGINVPSDSIGDNGMELLVDSVAKSATLKVCICTYIYIYIYIYI